MPIITIELLEGRSIKQKREIAKKVTEAIVETVKVKPDTVQIIFHDMKKENYAIAGNLYSDNTN